MRCGRWAGFLAWRVMTGSKPPPVFCFSRWDKGITRNCCKTSDAAFGLKNSQMRDGWLWHGALSQTAAWRFRYPQPGTPSVFPNLALRLAIVHQAVEDGGHRGQRIFVAQQHGRRAILNSLAYFPHAESAPCLHQHHAAGFGESGLTPSGLAIHQFEQVFA